MSDERLRDLLETCGRHLGPLATSVRVDPETGTEESYIDYEKIPKLVEALVTQTILKP